MITASDKAIEKLQQKLLRTCFEMGIGFKISGRTDESGQTSLILKIAKQQRGDEVTDLDGVKVYVDSTSAAMVEDWKLDYCDKPGADFFLLRECKRE